jgi:hypothetical protein
MAVIGYARVSTDGQTLDPQDATLRAEVQSVCSLSSNQVSRQTAQHWLTVTFGVSHSTISRLKPSIAA